MRLIPLAGKQVDEYHLQIVQRVDHDTAGLDELNR
jgi:hypothetical protein